MDLKEIVNENNRTVNKLSRENYSVYKKIDYYLGLSESYDKSKVLIKNDIVNMLYGGQEIGQSWQEIIGEDYKKFADEIFENRKTMDWKLNGLYFIKNLCMSFIAAMGLNMIFHLFSLGSESHIVGKILIDDIDFFNLGIFIIFNIFMMKLQNTRKVYNGKIFAGLVILYFISQIVFGLIFDDINKLVPIIIFLVLIIIGTVLLLIKPKGKFIDYYFTVIFTIYILILAFLKQIKFPEIYVDELYYVMVFFILVAIAMLLTKKFKKEMAKWINL